MGTRTAKHVKEHRTGRKCDNPGCRHRSRNRSGMLGKEGKPGEGSQRWERCETSKQSPQFQSSDGAIDTDTRTHGFVRIARVRNSEARHITECGRPSSEVRHPPA